MLVSRASAGALTESETGCNTSDRSELATPTSDWTPTLTAPLLVLCGEVLPGRTPIGMSQPEKSKKRSGSHCLSGPYLGCFSPVLHPRSWCGWSMAVRPLWGERRLHSSVLVGRRMGGCEPEWRLTLSAAAPPPLPVGSTSASARCTAASLELSHSPSPSGPSPFEVPPCPSSSPTLGLSVPQTSPRPLWASQLAQSPLLHSQLAPPRHPSGLEWVTQRCWHPFQKKLHWAAGRCFFDVHQSPKRISAYQYQHHHQPNNSIILLMICRVCGKTNCNNKTQRGGGVWMSCWKTWAQKLYQI